MIFPPCYSQSSLLTDFIPPLSPSKSGLKLVCNVNIVYGNLKSENSTNNTNTNNLFPPFPMRYNKVHNVNTVLNNKAQLKLFCLIL